MDGGKEMAELHPFVYYATRYPFSKGQASLSRIGYASGIYLISKGKGVVTTCGRRYETGPGSLVYIPAGQEHDWVADSDDPMVHICCYFDWSYRDRRAFLERPHIIGYDKAKIRPSLIGPAFPYPIPEHVLVDKLWIWEKQFDAFFTPNEYTSPRTYMRNLRVQSHFLQFIEFFLSYVLREEHIPDPRIAKVLEQMDQDLVKGELPSLDAYYGRLSISRGYFFERFRQATGISPVQYINQFRINRAKEDLQFSSLSVTEIAEKHGFSSIHYFSKLFRQLTGQTPKEYRESRR